MMLQQNSHKQILLMAKRLDWIEPNLESYPKMQLSEVEKCMFALIDDRAIQVEKNTGKFY